jgi:hypothetical protein
MRGSSRFYSWFSFFSSGDSHAGTRLPCRFRSGSGNPRANGGVSGRNRIAAWTLGSSNDSGWATLGEGLGNTVHSLAVRQNDLYAGGDFTLAGGQVSAYLAKAEFVVEPNIFLLHSIISEGLPRRTPIGSFLTVDFGGNGTAFDLVEGDGDEDSASFFIEGETLFSAAVFNFESQSSFNVRVRATDPANESIEKSFTITVVQAPEISFIPGSQTVTSGEIVNLSVEVTGTGPFTFQWFKDGTPLQDDERIAGSSTSSLLIENFSSTDTGSYWVTVTGVGETVTSDPVLVNVQSLAVVLHIESTLDSDHVVLRPLDLPGKAYQIEATADFGSSWAPLGLAVEVSSGVYESIDEEAGDFTARFYRAFATF